MMYKKVSLVPAAMAVANLHSYRIDGEFITENILVNPTPEMETNLSNFRCVTPEFSKIFIDVPYQGQSTET
jgi:hypothetical protein